MHRLGFPALAWSPSTASLVRAVGVVLAVGLVGCTAATGETPHLRRAYAPLRYDPSRAKQEACDGGDMHGCVELGHALRASALAGREREAFTAFERACTLGHAEACTFVSRGYERGADGAPAKDVGRAVSALERACTLGDLGGCTDLSFRYRTHPDGWPQDARGELSANERACALGGEASCGRAVETLLRGSEGIPVDRERAERSLRVKLCGPRDEGCRMELAAYYLRDAASSAPGDAERARTLLDEACTQREPLACQKLAGLLVRGVGGPKDIPRATGLLTSACDAGEGEACFGTGALRLLEPVKDFVGAERDFGRACAVVKPEALGACELRGARALAEAGAPARALPTFTRYCERGVAEACVGLGEVLARRGEARRAVDLFRRACDGRSASGCFQLAAMTASGRGTKKDLVAAQGLARDACARGHAQACSVSEQLASAGRSAAAGTQATVEAVWGALLKPGLFLPFALTDPGWVFSWWLRR